MLRHNESDTITVFDICLEVLSVHSNELCLREKSFPLLSLYYCHVQDMSVLCTFFNVSNMTIIQHIYFYQSRILHNKHLGEKKSILSIFLILNSPILDLKSSKLTFISRQAITVLWPVTVQNITAVTTIVVIHTAQVNYRVASLQYSYTHVKLLALFN